MDIFDSSVSDAYIRDKHEFAFEPKLLRDIAKLGALCTELISIIERDAADINIVKLKIPDNIIQTEYAQKYSQLSSKTDINLFSAITWTEVDEPRLSSLTTLLSSKDIENSYKLAELKLSAITKLSDQFAKMVANCSSEVQRRIIAEYISVEEQKRIVEEGTTVLNSSCSFSVNDKTWNALWFAARAYSEKIAYPSLQFPVIDSGSKCPLCQQELDANSIKRFKSFDEYIKGELNRTLSEKEDTLQKSIDSLTLSATIAEIDDWGKTCQIDLGLLSQIKEIYSKYISYVEKAQKEHGLHSEITIDISGVAPALIGLKEQCGKNLEEAKCLLDTTSEEKPKLEAEYRLLLSKKWVVMNIVHIIDEHSKYCLLDKLTNAKSKLSTRQITQKEKELSQELITDAYVRRFNYELQALGIKNVSVKCKTRGNTGKTYNSLILYNGEKEYSKPWEVLSEGEARIVSLAAFLADTRGSEALSPLVFDDPISSLDDKYEKSVVSRLIALASKRQIIVFTHRLTFYRDLQSQGDSENIKYQRIEIYRTAQDAGKIKDLSVLCGNVKGRLNRIKNETLQQAKKIYQARGCCDEYLEKMTSLCTTIRVTVEDLVADTLLGDVVSRYRPDIQTKGKLNRLADITAEECNSIDDWMTKYSNIMHSRPGERYPETFDENSEFSIAKIYDDLSEMIILNTAILARRK